MRNDRQKEIRRLAYSFREKCKVSRYGILDLFKECERCGYKVMRLPKDCCSQFIDSNNSLSNDDSDDKEIEANYFAVSLLMPEDEINRFLDIELDSFEEEGLSVLDIARIMTEFNVSFEMTLNTLVNYGKIKVATKNKLDNVKNSTRVGRLLKSVGGNALLNEISNTISIPHEYINYAIYNYNHNAIPMETLKRILEYYHLDVEDVSDELLKDEDVSGNDDLLELIGGLEE